MSDGFKYRMKGMDIRIKPPGKKLKPEDMPCEWAGCLSKGGCKAPKSPDRLREYYYFCAAHAREYNKNWNFFSGMNDGLGASLFTSYNSSEAYDPADNGLSAIPEFERWTFSPRLFFEGDSSELRAGLSVVTEDRLGGSLDYIEGDRSIPAYFEDSATERASSQLEYNAQLSSDYELVLRNSVNHYQRELHVPGFSFAGTQLSSFSEVHVLGATQNMDWVAGLNIWTEDFEQDRVVASSALDFDSKTYGFDGFIL